jgi:D-alanine--poly(phosphoribitol) ligase subunit 2
MPLTAESLIETIREASGLNGETTAESLLFSSGALDSVAMLELIMFVEQEAEIEIRADEVTLENFDSASRILRFAEARTT